MNAGKNFREIRENQNLTRTQLALKSNVSRSTIAKIELENSKPTSYTIYKLAKALNINELDLIEIFERN